MVNLVEPCVGCDQSRPAESQFELNIRLKIDGLNTKEYNTHGSMQYIINDPDQSKQVGSKILRHVPFLSLIPYYSDRCLIPCCFIPCFPAEEAIKASKEASART